jgi:hypothetical protein
MARQTIVRLRDDIDGGEAAETVQFTWAGTAYEIDLSKEHAAAFGEAVAPYLRAARRVRSGARRAGASRRSARPATSDVSAVRTWALEHGYAVSSRGRLPANIIAAFNAASTSAPESGEAAPARSAARKATKKAAPRKAVRASAGRKRAAKKAAPRASAAKKSARKSGATARRRGSQQ